MPVEFPTAGSECNTYGYTFDSNCTGANGKTLDYDQTWHALVLNGTTAWVPLSSPTVSGADGVDGPQGPQGATGSGGTEGPQGHTGVQGTNATDGAAGSQGHTGPQGRQGSTPKSPTLKSKDINVLETVFVESIDGNTFTVSSTDALTYDPSNLGALRINRIREDIGTVPAYKTSTNNLLLRGICGPSQIVSFTATAPQKIILDDTSTSDGFGTWKYWMPGDFMSVIIKQSAIPNNSWGQTGEGNQKFYKFDESEYTNNEVRFSGGATLPFGRSLGDVDMLYISCINEVGGSVLPYFIVNHIQFHDGED